MVSIQILLEQLIGASMQRRPVWSVLVPGFKRCSALAQEQVLHRTIPRLHTCAKPGSYPDFVRTVAGRKYAALVRVERTCARI